MMKSEGKKMVVRLVKEVFDLQQLWKEEEFLLL